MMKRFVAGALAVAMAVIAGLAGATDETGRKPAKVYAVVFDFECAQSAELGKQLADSVRLYLRRHEGYEVIDRLTTAEASGPLGVGTDANKVIGLMRNRVGANLGVCGTVVKSGQLVRAELRLIDLTDPNGQRGWTHKFSDDGERARGVVAREIVETIRTRNEWVPPQYGDEPEPKNFGKPLNLNGGFEAGYKGWDAPDNVSTFIEPGPPGRGYVLRIKTDLQRDPWLEYRRKLRFGRADPNHPPRIGQDTSYGSVAGLEGVHYRGEWIEATAGQRYWLIADMKGRSTGIFFPKIFVKGYMDWSDQAEALPEHSLIELKLTPQQFAKLPPDRRKALIAADASRHPERYRREVFRWYLACRNEEDVWKHYAAPCPPRGGLPKNVKWLRIEIYAYWPPGEFRFDNVHFYKDPAQTATLREEPMRTPTYPRTIPAREK